MYVDNYLDGGYHVHTIHPSLAGVLDYAHYRTEVHGWTSVQISPLKAADAADATARTRTGDAAQYWWVYPNFMVNLYQGVMDTNLVLPLGPDRCRVVFDFYFAETEGRAGRGVHPRQHGGGGSDSAGRYADMRTGAARVEQPVVHGRPVQRPAGEWRASFPSAAGGQFEPRKRPELLGKNRQSVSRVYTARLCSSRVRNAFLLAHSQ